MPISGLPAEILGEVVKKYSPPPLCVFETELGQTFRTTREQGRRSLVNKELRSLRLVSQLFNALASPLLFSDLTINFRGADMFFKKDISQDCIRCCDIIVALTSGTTTVFQHTRRLDISITYLFRAQLEGPQAPQYVEDLTAARELVKQELANAIACLRGVDFVSYSQVSATDPELISNEIISSLGTLPFLRHFNLKLDYPGPHFTLQSLSHLQSFKITWSDFRSMNILATEISSLFLRSPDLLVFSLESRAFQAEQQDICNDIFFPSGQNSEPLTLRELYLNGIPITSALVASSLRHLTNLEFLQVKYAPDGGNLTIGQICYSLKRNGINLTGIATDAIHDTLLLDYLAIHPGFKIIRFDATIRSPQAVRGELLQRLQNKILPAQKESLEELYIHVYRTHDISGHSLDAQLGSVMGCKRLWKFAISSTISKKEFEHGDTSIVERCLKTLMEIPHLKGVSLFFDSTTPGYDPESQSIMGKEQTWWKLAVSRLKTSANIDPETNGCLFPFDFKVFFFDSLRGWGITQGLEDL